MISAYLVDTAVLAYALGDPHPHRAACRRVVERATAGELVLHASVEMVQELLHHRMRRAGREAALRQARAAAGLCLLHPFDTAVLARALDLVSTTALRGRDAVHVGTALVHGLPRLISPDSDFDGLAELERVDPSALV